MLVYNLYRLGLLLLCLGLGWIAGLRSILLIVAALFISGVLSWFALRRQREAMGLAVEATVARGQRRFAARTAAEDEYVDHLLASQRAEPQPSRPGQPQDAQPPRGDQPAS